MHTSIHPLIKALALILSSCMLLCLLGGCASKDSILKPYQPMGDPNSSASANDDDNFYSSYDDPVKRIDGVSGNTLLIKEDSAYHAEDISAGEALLVNMLSGEVLLSKKSLTAIPAENFTKLFAAYVVFEKEESLERTVSIAQDVNNLSSTLARCKFQKDDIYMVKDLLYASLIYCANDAVVALAMGRPGDTISSFVKEMNDLSDRLNLKSTGFSNIYGYPNNGSKQETTLLDVYTVVREMLDKYPAFSEMIAEPVYYCTYQNSKNEPHSTSFSSSLPYYNTEESYDLPEHLELLGGICEPSTLDPTQIICIFRDAYGAKYMAILAGCSSYEDCYDQMQKLVSHIPSLY